MKKRNIIIYTMVTYVWSYTFWLIAIFMALDMDHEILLNEHFVKSLLTESILGEVMIISIIALAAVYGPLVGSLVLALLDKDHLHNFKKRLFVNRNVKLYLAAVIIFLLIGFVPSLPLIFVFGFTSESAITIILILILFFVIQLGSSGTEEFGWRGFLLPELLKDNNGWEASLKTGIIWALWHLPVVLYIFHLQGMPVFAMFFSFIGFSVGIVAMSVVHTYFFVKSKSVIFSVFVHAVSNTIPLISGLLIANSYTVAIASQILIWVVVAILVKKNKDLYYGTNIELD